MSVRRDRQTTAIGALVMLLVFGLVGLMALTRVAVKSPRGVYEVNAVFNRADGIGLRSEVRLSGIPVGEVVGYRLDDHYRAVVTMRLDLKNDLPDDAAASILTEGLFGGKYIELTTAGGGFGTIPSGDRVDFTQDSVVLEELLEKIVALAKVRRGMDPNRPAAEQQKPAERRAAPPGSDTEED